MKNIRSILITDCGSTTTKAILIEQQGDEYRLVTRGEAPTTVEAPVEDVTQGVLNSVYEVQELRGRTLLNNDHSKIITPQNENEGVDIYISTSSAGGGLQMMVAGVVHSMTAASAARAALGAGAIVMDTIAFNDHRLAHEKVERIRKLRPDMILLAGGTDGGTTKHPIVLAELLAAAQPKPRLGQSYNLPIIYAGNNEARQQVQEQLEDKAAFQFVDNVRPTLDKENLSPARDAIHTLFMEHVMAQAPGYDKLMNWSAIPIMPTPGAVGLMIKTLAERNKINVVGVDIGGATTDIFSVFHETFNRTVSANLGMSYSISNVLAESGMKQIQQWVPFDLNEASLRDRIGNKMIRPTTIPQSLEELKIEQSIAREALRLAFLHHKEFAVELKGVERKRGIGDAFNQNTDHSLVNLMQLELLVGSGGVLSHAPRRIQSMMMMIDAFEVEAITEIAVDSIFMMPHLGILSTIHPQIAIEVFEKDCLIRLGTCIAPVGKPPRGKPSVVIDFAFSNGQKQTINVIPGMLKHIPLGLNETAETLLTPAKQIDVGNGIGIRMKKIIRGGECGIIIDGRGRRPLPVATDSTERLQMAQQWNDELMLYPN